MKIAELIKSVFISIRTGNLLIICLTLFLVRYTLIKPLLEFGGITSSLPDHVYIIFVVSVLCIAAGGYVINDYYDTGIDSINKPGKNKIGAAIPRKSALAVYISLTLAGLFLAWLFGEKAGFRYPLLLILICAGLLYFYSATYKKMFLVGNIIIALLTAITIYLPLFFDFNARQASPIVILISAYAVFAFMMTLIREIIKDCEDAKGDQAFGSSTLPIIAGRTIAKVTAALLTLVVFGGLLWIQVLQQQWYDLIAFGYVSLLIQLPLLYLFYKILKSDSKADDRFNSNFTKIIMLTGILSMLVFYATSR